MKLCFEGDLSGLEAGIQILKDEIGVEVFGDGLSVKVEHSTGDIEIVKDDKQCVLRYHQKIHFFRALGLLVEALREKITFQHM